MPEEAAVRKIRAFVQQHAEKQDDTEARLSLSQMARQTGLSKWHFHRVFKKCVGVTPTEYLRIKRQGLGLQNLLQTAETSSVDKFDFETLSQDYDTRTWDESVACSGYVTTETPSTTLGDSPWSIDEFLIWPENNQLPIAQDAFLT